MQSMQELKKAILAELPQMMEAEPEIREFILRITREMYAGKQETESRFDRMMEELKKDREARDRKWTEHQKSQETQWREYQKSQEKKWREHQKFQETQWSEHQKFQVTQWREYQESQETKWREYQKFQEKKWEAQEKKWEENQKNINSILASIQAQEKKYESTIGALGARWGLHLESAFRNGLKAILVDSFGFRVERYEDYDHEGRVFGRPEQIELDVIIHNNTVILCELKSSMDKAGIYSFWRKKAFYEQKHGRKVSRAMVISPMIDDQAKRVAQELGIETYFYADSVQFAKE